MTTIRARVVEDSISPAGIRLVSLECRYPLVIHAELMTHRVFSRNARSSRAVPIERMIAEVMEDPFIPLHWGAAQRGMTADNECDAKVQIANEDSVPWFSRQEAWLWARDQAVEAARAFMKAGYAKQVVNRLLAPFLHIDVLVTSTEWDNFFKLRFASDAEPHMRLLARHMGRAMALSSPKPLNVDSWHLPYVDKSPDGADALAIKAYVATLEDGDPEHYFDVLPIAKKLSVARCARISYAPFDGAGDIVSELRRYDLLATSGHWSPFEHQATPDAQVGHTGGPIEWGNPQDHRNFVGWRQNRDFAEREAA